MTLSPARGLVPGPGPNFGTQIEGKHTYCVRNTVFVIHDFVILANFPKTLVLLKQRTFPFGAGSIDPPPVETSQGFFATGGWAN